MEKIPRSMNVILIDYKFESEELYYIPFLVGWRLIKFEKTGSPQTFSVEELLENNVVAINLSPKHQNYPKSDRNIIRMSLKQGKGTQYNL